MKRRAEITTSIETESRERERELTGFDAAPAEAEVGSASPNNRELEADLTGGFRELEEEAFSEDILPDQVRQVIAQAPREEPEVTARPVERREEDQVNLKWRHLDDRPGFSTPDSETP